MSAQWRGFNIASRSRPPFDQTPPDRTSREEESRGEPPVASSAEALAQGVEEALLQPLADSGLRHERIASVE